MLTFTHLNTDWNADPNAPELSLSVASDALVALFRPNTFIYPRYGGVAWISVRFEDCQQYRLTSINDHGWYAGQCRFSGLAPNWGEFYEISGDTREHLEPTPWTHLQGTGTRHFHFYLCDETLEVKALNWSFKAENAAPSLG